MKDQTVFDFHFKRRRRGEHIFRVLEIVYLPTPYADDRITCLVSLLLKEPPGVPTQGVEQEERPGKTLVVSRRG